MADQRHPRSPTAWSVRTLQAFIVTMAALLVSACGGGDGDGANATGLQASSADPSDAADKATLAVGATTVPAGWAGRVPAFTINPNTGGVDGQDYSTVRPTATKDVNPAPTSAIVRPDGFTHDSDRIRVIARNGTSFAAIDSWAKGNGWSVVGHVASYAVYVLALNNRTSVDNAVVTARASGLMLSAVPVSRGTANTITKDPWVDPNDPGKTGKTFDGLLADIRAPAAWALLPPNTRTVDVGVLDGGFRYGKLYGHEDLSNLKNVGSFNYATVPEAVEVCIPQTDSQEDPCLKSLDHYRHGMHVAGILAATPDNGRGVAGVSGEQTNLHAYRTDFELANIAKGFERLQARNVAVINMSVGYSHCVQLKDGKQTDSDGKRYTCRANTHEEDANDRIESTISAFAAVAKNPNVLFVHASGNEGDLTPDDSSVPWASNQSGWFASGASKTWTSHPQSGPEIDNFRKNVLVVGSYSVDANGVRKPSPFTMLPAGGEDGQYPFLLAPGDQVLSTAFVSTSAYVRLPGTSMAAPHVAGVAALLKRANDGLTAQEIQEIILSTADTNLRVPFKCHPTKGDGHDGYRYLNAEAAVREALDRMAAPPESLEAAFTTRREPSKPWSFGWQVASEKLVPYASFQPACSRSDFPTFSIWNKVSGSANAAPVDVYPWVVKNTGASPVPYGSSTTPFPAQSVIVTPGSAGERAVFRWTAPTAGRYEITASFELMKGGLVDVFVQQMGIDIFAERIAGLGSKSTLPKTVVTLKTGETIDFVVGDGGNTQNSDITRVAASVKAASASDHDLASDFSMVGNPNGAWSYGHFPYQSVSLFNVFGFRSSGSTFPEIKSWTANTPYSLYVAKNTGSATVVFANAVAPAGAVILHPGYNGEAAAVRWTAPRAGTFDVVATFKLAEAVGSVDAHIYRNGVKIFSTFLAPSAQEEAALRRVTVAANDTLDFVVGNGGDNYLSDTTLLSVRINPAP